MSVDKDLLDSISAALPDTITPSLKVTGSSSDLFEAFTFTLVLIAAQREGAAVSFRGPDDKPTSQFIFRTSPGYIWSKQQNYTFAVIEFLNADPLEAHLGVRVSGKSRVLHEFDVSVIYRSEAVTCRSAHVHPRQSRVVIGTECKFCTSSLSLGLARSFIGLGVDTTVKNNFFVTNTSSPSVEKLLSANKRQWANEVYPGASVALERQINAFQIVFKDFKAKYRG